MVVFYSFPHNSKQVLSKLSKPRIFFTVGNFIDEKQSIINTIFSIVRKNLYVSIDRSIDRSNRIEIREKNENNDNKNKNKLLNLKHVKRFGTN